MTRRLTWVLVLALAACDGGGETPADSGSTRDSGTPDAGAPVDAGGPADAGPPDAGPPDAGPPTCEMGRIHIEERCEPEFVACGGDLLRGGMSAEWCYADICITKNELLAAALAMVGGGPSGCSAEAIGVVSSTGSIDGTITFTDTGTVTTMTRSNIETSATGTFDVPPECLIGTRCELTGDIINQALMSNEAGSAACSEQAGKCFCDITFQSTLNEMDVVYTIDTDTNSVVTASGRRFDYCIEADGSLRFNEDEATGLEPGVQLALPVN